MSKSVNFIDYAFEEYKNDWNDSLQKTICSKSVINAIEKYANIRSKTEIVLFINWFNKNQQYKNMNSDIIVEIWRKSEDYNKHLLNGKPSL